MVNLMLNAQRPFHRWMLSLEPPGLERAGAQKTIDAHLGGIKGCMHLRELLTTLATAAYQSIPGAFLTLPVKSHQPT
ncbi:DUF2889 domain-containing protein [Polynucleobacter necessarius]|uniref:DUF2889 domain-containing protein n=1 Tax=Polynucleobacter necessarius TaxID=576610 RepID=UPI0039E5EFC4